MRTCSSKQKNSRTTVTKPVFLSPTLSKLNTNSIGLNFEFGILVFFLKYFCKLCAQGKLLTFSNRNTIFYSFMCKMSSKLTVWQVEASCAKCLQSWQFDKLKPHVQNTSSKLTVWQVEELAQQCQQQPYCTLKTRSSFDLLITLKTWLWKSHLKEIVLRSIVFCHIFVVLVLKTPWKLWKLMLIQLLWNIFFSTQPHCCLLRYWG